MINAGPCYRCRSEIVLPDELYHAAKRSPRITFWCPFGHEQYFVEGETDEQKLRRERDRLAQRIAERDDDVRRERELREATERRLSAARGQVTRIKNRVGNGVCPCCNRSFSNLHNHMHKQHPDYAKDDAAKIAAE